LEVKGFSIGLDKNDKPVLELRVKPDVIPKGAGDAEYRGRIGVAFVFIEDKGPTVIIVDVHKAGEGKKNVVKLAREKPDAIIGVITLMEYAKTREEKRNVIKWLELIGESGELTVETLYEPVTYPTGLPHHRYAVTAPISCVETKPIPPDWRTKIRKMASLAKEIFLKG